MADILKPLYGNVWAEEGEKLSPGNAKIAAGWVKEMMPYQYENFLQNRVDNAITYILQKGVPEWDASQEYTANKSVVTYSGQLYMALTTNTNVLPIVTASWKKLSVTFGTNGAIPIVLGGTGATNAADARTNLGIGSAATVNLPTTNGMVVKLADNSLVARSITGTTGYITVTNPDGVSGSPTINVGANVAKTDADAAWSTKTSIKIPSGTSSERGIGAPGRIRFNMESGVYEGYDNTGWNPIGSTGTLDVQNFSGDGVKTSFTMSATPRAENNTQVYFNGVYQQKNSYNLVGSALVFDEAPALGIEIEVVTVSSVDIGTTTAGQTSIVDSGNYYNSTNVEGALAEAGNKQYHTILTYGTKTEADAAAATLPDGQVVEVLQDEVRYSVQSGALVFEKNLDQLRDDLAQPDGNDPVGGFDTYAKLRAYDGSATRAKVIGSGIEGDFALVSSSDADDGVGLIVDVLGRRWKRLAEGSLNVKASGAVPNSVINNRVSIQNAMNWCAKNGVTLIVDDVYYVSADATAAGVDPFALIAPSGLDMHFVGAGELRQFGSPFVKSSVLLLKDTAGANIWNPRIVGTRLTASASLPEQNHGLTILECSDVYIHKPIISNTMGDGIYVGRTWSGGGLKSPTRVTVFEPVIDRVRRNGISCTAWDDVKIIRPKITNVRDIDGVAAIFPKAGIDIEPEHDGADGEFVDRLKLSGLEIVDPVVQDCIVAMQSLFTEHCKNMMITAKVSGDFRFRASGDAGLYPLNLIYVGTGCTGSLVFDKITDTSAAASGAEVRVTMAWNYQANGFSLRVQDFDTRVKTSGMYAFLWFMDVDDPKYLTAQGGVSFENVILTDGVRGALGYRNPTSMNATRKLTNVRFTSASTALGGRGIENAEYLNSGAIPQGDNCYFDAIRIYDYLPTQGKEWGNRTRLNDAMALNYGKYTLDVRDKIGVFETIRPWTQTPEGYFIEVVGITTSVSGTIYNAIRSTSRSARAVVRKTAIESPAEVIETSGEWVAFNAV